MCYNKTFCLWTWNKSCSSAAMSSRTNQGHPIETVSGCFYQHFWSACNSEQCLSQCSKSSMVFVKNSWTLPQTSWIGITGVGWKSAFYKLRVESLLTSPIGNECTAVLPKELLNRTTLNVCREDKQHEISLSHKLSSSSDISWAGAKESFWWPI